jgi:DNA-binding response OmpR family regulator
MLALLLLDGEPDADQVWRPQPYPDMVPLLTDARILLAEDDAVLRGMIERILLEQGCEVLAARDGEEALGLALGGAPPFDLVVTDVRMPRMGGWELGRSLGDRWPDLPILYISGWDSELVGGAHQGGRRHGFLRKPFDPSDLVSHVERLLRRP